MIVIVGTYYSKAAEVRAIRFASNNEPNNENLNAICLTVNQGRPHDSDYHCWHNGTNIFVQCRGYHFATAVVGEWIVMYPDGRIEVVGDSAFNAGFERVSRQRAT